MKESYRISKILKKLTGINLKGSQRDPEISGEAKKQSDTYYSSRKHAGHIHKTANRKDRSDPRKEELRKKFVVYQKEIQAGRLLNAEKRPDPPGKILKLPVIRKEMKLEKPMESDD